MPPQPPDQGLSREMIRGSPNLLLDQDGVWGPPTMPFGGIWQYFSTSRLKIGRPKDGWTGLWQSPCPRQPHTPE